MSDRRDGYSIGEVAARTGLDPDTLRYFERQGVLPPPERDGAGHRAYDDADVDLIEMLIHLREAGMPLAEIARFTGASPDDAAEVRIELLRAHRRRIQERRDALDRALEVVGRKIADHSDPAAAAPDLLERPDASIAYSAGGQGPLLFLVGAPVGRAGFADLARELESRFTVVTHDPRGIGESPWRPGSAEPTPSALAEDLAALVDVFTGSPALFFGASGGAVTVLELATRHPELVRGAVLHEPPLVSLLGDDVLAGRAAAAFARAGSDPQRAAQEFFDLSGAGHLTGPDDVPPAHTPLPALPSEELEKNRWFLGRMAGPSVFYEPDAEALRRVGMAVCAGSRSHHQLARRAAGALADLLGTRLIDMPGNHLGPSTMPAEFAAALVPIIAELEARG